VAIPGALDRLFRVRELEEEQCRTAVEEAAGQVRRLENAVVAAQERKRHGRMLVAASAQSGDLLDRVAGLEEMRSAGLAQENLSRRVKDAETALANLRQRFLAKRVERRQVETLLKQQEAALAFETDRRDQRVLDDWHRMRGFRERGEAQLKRRNCDGEEGLLSGGGRAENLSEKDRDES
jgi:flagellar export protein FliJ